MIKNIKGVCRWSSAMLLLSAGLISCSKGPVIIPPEVISRDSMIHILADIHIAEARVVTMGYKPDHREFKAAYMNYVFTNTQTDTARFNSSFAFYTSHPEYFHDMYEDVITEISRRQAERHNSEK